MITYGDLQIKSLNHRIMDMAITNLIANIPKPDEELVKDLGFPGRQVRWLYDKERGTAWTVGVIYKGDQEVVEENINKVDFDLE